MARLFGNKKTSGGDPSCEGSGRFVIYLTEDVMHRAMAFCCSVVLSPPARVAHAL